MQSRSNAAKGIRLPRRDGGSNRGGLAIFVCVVAAVAGSIAAVIWISRGLVRKERLLAGEARAAAEDAPRGAAMEPAEAGP